MTTTAIAIAKFTAAESTDTNATIDRLSLALSTTRSRRGIFALGAAMAALAVGSASAATHENRDDRGNRQATRNRRGAVARAAAVTSIPALDPNAISGNAALNSFNLLMNRLVGNYGIWQSAIAAPIPSTQRKQIAALGSSIADDLGKIASHEKTLASVRSITWKQAGDKLASMGIDKELQKYPSGLTMATAITSLTAVHGSTLGGAVDYYLASKADLAAEITLIRKQVNELLSTGSILSKSAGTTGAAGKGRDNVSSMALPTCRSIINCVLVALASVGVLAAVVAVTLCVLAGPAAPICLASVLGCAGWLLERFVACGAGKRCR